MDQHSLLLKQIVVWSTSVAIFLLATNDGYPFANVEGFDIQNKVVFWQLGAGKLDAADSESNWLDGFQPEATLKQLFPGFMKKIADESWEETLNLAIYWYLRGDTSKQVLMAQ